MHARVHSERVKQVVLGSPAVGATTAVHAAANTSGTVTTEVTTALTNPDACRNVTATAGGTAGDIKAVAVTVTGTDYEDQPITETLPVFTENTPGTVVGSKAFKTVTGYSVPAMDGNGVTVALGTGAKLGLPQELERDSIVAAYLADVREATRPTVVVDDDEVEKNTITLNSALNGTEVRIDYYDTAE